MFTRLLVLEWKSFFRSSSFGSGLAIKLLMGFLAIYFLFVFFSLGLGLYALLEENFPNEEPLMALNRHFLYWFVGSFLFRMMLQKLPLLNIKPLLIHNIPRSTIVHYTLAKTLYAFFNLLLVVCLIPFTIVVHHSTGMSYGQLLPWLLAILFTEYALNFTNLLVQNKSDDGIKKLLPILVFGLICYALDYFKIFSFASYFGAFYDVVLENPVLLVVPVILAVLCYYLLFKDIRNRFYLDSFIKTKNMAEKDVDLSWTDRFGGISPFLQLDLRLIWRNKRPRHATVIGIIFLAYGLMFYTDNKYADSSMYVFAGIFMTGIFLMNFGQFIPSWDSSYYPMLMTQDISFKQYLESKVILMYISVAILFVLSTPYIYYGWNIVETNLACAVYNIGINVPVILYFGTKNRKRIDLDNGNWFNSQGIGAAQWLVGFPLLVPPIIFWAIPKVIWNIHVANAILMLIGIVGLIFRSRILSWISEKYANKKYKMLTGFKEVNN